MPKSSKNDTPCHLKSTSRGWWQCGMWVHSQEEATTYPNANEADLVRSLRKLPVDTEIIPA